MFGHKFLFLFFTGPHEIIDIVMFSPAFINYIKTIYNIKSDFSGSLANPFTKKQALLFCSLQYILNLYWCF